MENNKNAQNDKYTINISCFFYITSTFVPSYGGRFIIFIAEITQKHKSIREDREGQKEENKARSVSVYDVNMSPAVEINKR